MVKRTLTAVAVATVALTTPTTPAQAAFVQECTTVGVATFSPKLTTQLLPRTLSFEYDYTCVVVADDGSSGVKTGHTTFSVPLNGSCLTATTPGGVLVGGVGALSLQTAADVGTRVTVFVPTTLDPCDMDRATFVGTGPDVFL